MLLLHCVKKYGSLIPGTSWLYFPCPPWTRQPPLSTVPIPPNFDSTPSNSSSVWGLVLEGISGKLVLRIPGMTVTQPLQSWWLYCGSPALGFIRCYPAASFKYCTLPHLGAGGALSPAARISGVVRVSCYLALLSTSSCCCSNTGIEELCHHHYLPGILSIY